MRYITRFVTMAVTVIWLAAAVVEAAPRRVKTDDDLFEFWTDDDQTFYTIVVPEDEEDRNGDLWIIGHGERKSIHVPQRQDADAVDSYRWLAERLGYTVASVNYGDHRHQGWAVTDQADLTESFARFVREKYGLTGKTLVMGESRGAWVSMLCMLRHPKTFDAGLADSGVTDVNGLLDYSMYLFRKDLAVMDYSLTGLMMRNLTQGAAALDGPPTDRDTGRSSARLSDMSPVSQADRLAGKLVITAGDTDTRVPPYNMWQMVDALKRNRKSQNFAAISYTSDGHNSPGGTGDVRRSPLMLTLAEWARGRSAGLLGGRTYGPRHWSADRAVRPKDFDESPLTVRASNRNMLRMAARRGTGSCPGGVTNAFMTHDLDGNGAAELIYGDAEGFLHILKLDAGGLTETWRSHSLGAPILGLDVGDMDDDGKLEIAASSANSKVMVVRSRTPDGTVWEFTDPLGQLVHRVKILDVDGDGRSELLCWTSDGYMFSFDGVSHKIKKRSPYLGSTFAALMVAADTDGDGATELYTGDHAGYVNRLDGSTLEVASTSPYMPMCPWSGVVGDFTGRLGSELLLAGTSTWGGMDHPHTYVIEDDVTEPRKLSEVPGFFTAAAGNLDEDLFDEAVLGGLSRVMVMDGQSFSTRTLFESKTDTVMTGVAIGDMNGDGSPEVAAASREGNIWVLDPKTGAVVSSLEGMAGTYGVCIVETGMNEPDIVVGTRDRQLKWLDATDLETVDSVPISQWVHSLATTDLTGDGVSDIVGSTGENIHGEPDGMAFAVDGVSKRLVWRTRKPQGRMWGLETGDMNGDGVPDIVLGSTYTDRSDVPETVMLDFIDMDGEPFRVPVTHAKDRASLQVYDGNSHSLLAETETPGHDLFGMAAGDLDADGTTEVAVGDRRGIVRVYTLSGDRPALEWESPDLGTEVVGMTFADVKGTGRGELVCGTEDGRLHQIAGSNDTYVVTWTGPDLGSHLWGVAVDDIDNDGTAEIVTANANGSMFVLNAETHRLEFRRDGLGTFAGAYNSIVIDDIDRDGHKELIIGSSGYLYLFEATL